MVAVQPPAQSHNRYIIPTDISSSQGKKYTSPNRQRSTSRENSLSPSKNDSKHNESIPTLPNLTNVNLKKSQDLDESIKSDIPLSINPIATVAPNPITDSQKNQAAIEESSQSVSGAHPKMRRVRNPYGSSEHSSSHKSGTLSQSLQKSKRKIEIEKLSDHEEDAYDDSYMNDEFENTVDSFSIDLKNKKPVKPNDNTRNQPTLISQQASHGATDSSIVDSKQQNSRIAVNAGSGRKLRQS